MCRRPLHLSVQAGGQPKPERALRAALSASLPPETGWGSLGRLFVPQPFHKLNPEALSRAGGAARSAPGVAALHPAAAKEPPAPLQGPGCSALAAGPHSLGSGLGSPEAMRGRSATSATLRATRTALLATDWYTVLRRQAGRAGRQAGRRSNSAPLGQTTHSCWPANAFLLASHHILLGQPAHSCWPARRVYSMQSCWPARSARSFTRRAAHKKNGPAIKTHLDLQLAKSWASQASAAACATGAAAAGEPPCAARKAGFSRSPARIFPATRCRTSADATSPLPLLPAPRQCGTAAALRHARRWADAPQRSAAQNGSGGGGVLVPSCPPQGSTHAALPETRG